DGLVAVEKYVDINQPRTLRELLFAAHARFYVTETMQQVQSRHMGLALYNTIQKPRLFQVIHWLRLVDRRYLHHAQAGRRQRSNGRTEIRFAIPYVRTQR